MGMAIEMPYVLGLPAHYIETKGSDVRSSENLKRHIIAFWR